MSVISITLKSFSLIVPLYFVSKLFCERTQSSIIFYYESSKHSYHKLLKGDGGPAVLALSGGYISDLALDISNNLYVVDTFDCVIRKFTKSTGEQCIFWLVYPYLMRTF